MIFNCVYFYKIPHLNDEYFLFTDTRNSLQLDSRKKAIRIGNWLSR